MMVQTTTQPPEADTPGQVHGASLRVFRAELPVDMLDGEGELLDWVIGFMFDTLGAVHLMLRITAVAGWPEQQAGKLCSGQRTTEQGWQ